MATATLPLHVAYFLHDRWRVSDGHRGLALAAAAATAALVVAITIVSSASLTSRLGRARAYAIGGGASVLVALWLPGGMYVAMVGSVGVGFGLLVASAGLAVADMHDVTAARERPIVAALVCVYGGMGAVFALLTLSSVEVRLGSSVSLGLSVVPAALAALAGGLDPSRAEKDRRARDERDALTADANTADEDVPLLEVDHVDFSYGQVQVLFDVGITVGAGEIVALLGTNGSGKSTLLKVISGLAIPERGAVRLTGADITHTDAEDRVGMGISQIAGGNAVFPQLTVAENLALFARTIDFDRRLLDEGMERVFAAFPELQQRRDVKAGDLSGGQRQMLGLSKALLLQPPLLLIDELSLGLAPTVVSQLLETVRAINRGGTAVVVVEQSVGVALEIAERAYFLEKGTVRFSGPTAELVERVDLIRSVFIDP